MEQKLELAQAPQAHEGHDVPSPAPHGPVTFPGLGPGEAPPTYFPDARVDASRRVPPRVAEHLDDMRIAERHDQWHTRWEGHTEFLARHDAFLEHLREAVPEERAALSSASIPELQAWHRTLGEVALDPEYEAVKSDFVRGQRLIGIFLDPEPTLRECRGPDGRVSIAELAAILRPLHNKLHAALGWLVSQKDPLHLNAPDRNVYSRDFYGLIHGPLHDLMMRVRGEASDAAAYGALVEQRKQEMGALHAPQ